MIVSRAWTSPPTIERARRSIPHRFVDPLPRGTRLDPGLLREVNRQIAKLAEQFDGPLAFVCECGADSCDRPLVEIPPDQIDSILAGADSYVLAAGHAQPRAM